MIKKVNIRLMTENKYINVLFFRGVIGTRIRDQLKITNTLLFMRERNVIF